MCLGPGLTGPVFFGECHYIVFVTMQTKNDCFTGHVGVIKS